jgi:hypothetical protein
MKKMKVDIGGEERFKDQIIKYYMKSNSKKKTSKRTYS